MIKRSALLALAFACIPMIANANVISLEYTGHITTLFGDGNGYSMGDAVSGKLDVDFSKAIYVDSNTPNTVIYQAPVSQGLVVGAVDTDAEGWNHVEVSNDSHENWLGEREDFFQILESRPSALLPGWVDAFQFTLIIDGYDWLTDLTLNNINIITNDTSALTFSLGALSQSLSSVDADGNFSFQHNAAIFSLDSVKLVSTQVPEPSSIALILIGGLALVIRRKRS